MRNHSLPIVQLTRARAAFSFDPLLTELQLLMGAFPDLQDAFDADELPLAFILKRDSHLTPPAVRPRIRFSRQAKSSPRPRTTSSRTHNRRSPRKLIFDE